jgi:hypothetical protein
MDYGPPSPGIGSAGEFEGLSPGVATLCPSSSLLLALSRSILGGGNDDSAEWWAAPKLLSAVRGSRVSLAWVSAADTS